MSRAQGDGFRTWTNRGLNDYRDRLDEKLAGLCQHTARWYDNRDGFWVLAESWNVLENPNGSWKWHGWQVVGKEYKLQVYEEGALDLSGDEPQVEGPSIVCRVFDDRDEANAFFLQLRAK